MSIQKIDAVTREAIWSAHNRRCFYCTHPILFADVEIDHFIPETISAGDLAGLVERGVIPSDFDLLGPDNLVPACRRHNCSKSDIILSDNFIALQIAVITKMAARYGVTSHSNGNFTAWIRSFGTCRRALTKVRFLLRKHETTCIDCGRRHQYQNS